MVPVTEVFICSTIFDRCSPSHLRFAKEAAFCSRKLRYLRRVGESSRATACSGSLPPRPCVLLRTRYGRGISMAPTAYATAADEVSRSARLWTIV